MAASHFYAEVDPDECSGCGVCIDRCQFHAIAAEDICVINKSKCYGCGLCVAACPEKAISLVRKPECEIGQTPLLHSDWRKIRRENREK